MTFFSTLIQLLEKNNRIMSGAGQSVAAIVQMTHAFDESRKPFMIALYDSIGVSKYQMPRDIVEARHLFPGAILQIGLQLPVRDEQGLRDLGDGLLDHQIDQLVTAYKNLNTPIILRIGYEFEGPWNGYNPEDYIKAYRRIVNTFRNQKALLVSFWWNAYTGSEHEIDSWFPGEAYIDWLGYNVITDHFDGSWYLKKMSDLEKPFLIGEASYAMNDNNLSFNEWMDQFFESMELSGIRGYQYINWDWHLYPKHMGWSTWENGLFTEDSNKVAYYNKKLDHPSYLFRDEHYHQPIKLFIDFGRGSNERSRINKTWDVISDHGSHESGYAYEVISGEIYYGDGFNPYIQAAVDHIEISLHLPSPFEGFLTLDIGRESNSLGIFSIWIDDQVFRVTGGKGYTKIPLLSKEPNKVITIAILQSGQKSRLKNLGLMTIHPMAKPIEHLSYNYKIHVLSWTPVEEVIGYNIYKNHELIGMATEVSYKCEQNKYLDRVSVTAVYKLHGESAMTYLKV
jgi:hypothetical protein